MAAEESDARGTATRLDNEGWAQLAGGEWRAAKESFSAALEIEAKPELLEGLSWAAWWLDEAEVVFASRQRAFSLYREAGDRGSAARMATWLAADHLDFHGALAVANGWIRNAQRLLEAVEPGPDHGWLFFHEGYLALVQGDHARAAELAARTAALGTRHEVPDLEMLGLALHGAVLVAAADVEEGMACLDEATALALGCEPEIPISRAWACCFLVSACESVLDFTRAFEWCDRIAEFSERYGSRYMLGFCRAHYAAVHVWRGRWREAEADYEAALDAYSRSRPAMASEAIAGLAELRRRQGRLDDAERLLGEAAGGSALLCRARMALDRGEHRAAAELAERLLRKTADHRRLARAPVLELLVRAGARTGELAAASAALEELKELAVSVGTEAMSAAAALAEGVFATAAGESDNGRKLLEDAVDSYEAAGAPFEAARARIELAHCLIAAGRRKAARREIRLCLERLEKMGAVGEAERARKLLDPLDGEARRATSARRVTRRERDVLRCVAEGLTNREIAERLILSEHTVHRHITNILRKMDLPSRAAAAALAARTGLLDSPET